MLPPTPATTLLFGAIMGFLWMGVGPLVAGAVAEMFGLQWQAMIQGLAFMSHQLGSFLGAYGGGLIYDALGSYTHGLAHRRRAGPCRRHHPGRVRADPADPAAAAGHGIVKIKTGPQGPVEVSSVPRSYLILLSRNSTCLRATGSYFFLTSFSVMVREFFLAT